MISSFLYHITIKILHLILFVGCPFSGVPSNNTLWFTFYFLVISCNMMCVINNWICVSYGLWVTWKLSKSTTLELGALDNLTKAKLQGVEFHLISIVLMFRFVWTEPDNLSFQSKSEIEYQPKVSPRSSQNRVGSYFETWHFFLRNKFFLPKTNFDSVAAKAELCVGCFGC